MMNYSQFDYSKNELQSIELPKKSIIVNHNQFNYSTINYN